jgi:predicted RND superfamily exporter protein
MKFRGLKSFLGAYDRLVLGNPKLTLTVLAVMTLSVGWFSQDFALDASAEALVLENDEGLRYYRSVTARYGSDDYLIVTYTPRAGLFEAGTLEDLKQLHDALAAVPNVQDVTSILNVPLLSSPPVDLRQLSTGIRYLKDANTDRTLAQKEILDSPMYRNLIVSADGMTTALRVDLLQDVDIAAVREVLHKHGELASLHLGGLPMIVADSIDFIRHDLLVFGIAVLVFLVVILSLAFKRRRWIFLPLLTCAATCLFMIGLLGLSGSRVTVVSSNFVPLLLILCLALTLHIIVRYRETHEKNPEADQFTLVRETVHGIAAPCLYTALTTIVAFGSLLVSGIRPVIDFGWMMSIGIVVAFIFSFTLFPAALMLLTPGQPRSRNDATAAITAFFARLIHRHGKATAFIFVLVFAIALIGMTRLSVENRFIDYYRKSTEIYQGMELIDLQLGGTTPLDVIIDAPVAEPEVDEEFADDYVDLYEGEGDAEAGITARSYWFNSWRIEDIVEIHEYLDNLPQTGKVISLATIARILEQLEPQVLHDNFAMSVIYERLQADVKQELFSPYMSEDGQQIRFSVRVFESDPTLRRTALLEQIRTELVEKMGLDPEQIHLTGMLVLYNNMLQSLFRSQIATLGAVFLAIFFMFLILFRSAKLSLIALIPNLVSAALVLGLMGWFGIPLDLMTITIAAITVGIGVDDTIHYVHRFRDEIAVDGDYWAAVGRCHLSIGRAIYYTSVTIMLGFSILALSQFVPTIYFGLLTGVAMLAALLANLTLLPLLIVTVRPGNI